MKFILEKYYAYHEINEEQESIELGQIEAKTVETILVLFPRLHKYMQQKYEESKFKVTAEFLGIDTKDIKQTVMTWHAKIEKFMDLLYRFIKICESHTDEMDIFCNRVQEFYDLVKEMNKLFLDIRFYKSTVLLWTYYGILLYSHVDLLVL